jgi:hypothetical protein
MQVGLHHCVFDELPYSWEPLWAWYQEHQHTAVYFNDWMNARVPVGGTKFRGSGAGFKTLDLDGQLGRIIRDEPEINHLLRQWTFYDQLKAFDVDIMIYPPNYTLRAHTDHYMGCGIMYPIMPENPSGIDFYRTPPGMETARAREYDVVVERDLIYTYNYVRGCPSMFNGQVIHGVRNGGQERVFLRVKLREQTFQSVLTLAEKNSLFVNRS